MGEPVYRLGARLRSVDGSGPKAEQFNERQPGADGGGKGDNVPSEAMCGQPLPLPVVITMQDLDWDRKKEGMWARMAMA